MFHKFFSAVKGKVLDFPPHPHSKTLGQVIEKGDLPVFFHPKGRMLFTFNPRVRLPIFWVLRFGAIFSEGFVGWFTENIQGKLPKC